MLVFDDLIGKDVLIIKKDGYVKYGKLLEVADDFLKLQYKDGSIAYVRIVEISSINEDKGGI